LRRLDDGETDDLVFAYRAGRTLADLARELGIRPRTVAARLDTRDVPRQANRRKMSDHDLSEAPVATAAETPSLRLR
jgi:sulfur carrier protein ThiS